MINVNIDPLCSSWALSVFQRCMLLPTINFAMQSLPVGQSLQLLRQRYPQFLQQFSENQ